MPANPFIRRLNLTHLIKNGSRLSFLHPPDLNVPGKVFLSSVALNRRLSFSESVLSFSHVRETLPRRYRLVKVLLIH